MHSFLSLLRKHHTEVTVGANITVVWATSQERTRQMLWQACQQPLPQSLDRRLDLKVYKSHVSDCCFPSWDHSCPRHGSVRHYLHTWKECPTAAWKGLHMDFIALYSLVRMGWKDQYWSLHLYMVGFWPDFEALEKKGWGQNFVLLMGTCLSFTYGTSYTVCQDVLI